MKTSSLLTLLSFSATLVSAMPVSVSTDGINGPIPAAATLLKRTAANIPTQSEAQKMLDGLTVSPKKNTDSYNRKLFKHWIAVNGTCNVRETVLKRDGTDVGQDDACKAIRGNWKSPYDGASWKSAADIQIDHLVPLQEAWSSGASEWDNKQRQVFANDLVNPQLWAVTGTVNNAKGADDPSKWKPPLTSFHCTYAKSYTKVKSVYKLTVTAEEKKALAGMVGGCKE